MPVMGGRLCISVHESVAGHWSASRLDLGKIAAAAWVQFTGRWEELKDSIDVSKGFLGPPKLVQKLSLTKRFEREERCWRAACLGFCFGVARP